MFVETFPFNFHAQNLSNVLRSSCQFDFMSKPDYTERQIVLSDVI